MGGRTGGTTTTTNLQSICGRFAVKGGVRIERSGNEDETDLGTSHCGELLLSCGWKECWGEEREE